MKQTPQYQELKDILSKRIMVIDGAMGTMIQRYKLSEEDFRGERFKDFHADIKGNNEILSLTRPDIIVSIHKEYLDAGADIIETNTFSANTVSQADYDLQDICYELTFESAQLPAISVAEKNLETHEKPRF